MAGPLAWPNAYEDIIGFAFWPKEYGERLRTHGIGDVLFAVFAPRILTSRLRAQTAQDRNAPATTGSISLCGGTDQPPPDWPANRIERSIKLNQAQREALDQFSAAVGEALKSIKSTCRDEAALAPVDRLRAMQATLWAVHDAVIRIRAPLAKFHDSLTDDQKKLFMLTASEADPRGAAIAGPSMTIEDYARMCGMPKMDDGGMQYIEENLRPNGDQRASLDAIQTKAADMGRLLMASCLRPIGPNPVERLDAAADRLTAVIFATSNIGLALNDLYYQLSDEQKTKLGSFAR
jgi:LTXXQ motif family protein